MTKSADTIGRITISFPITFSLVCAVALLFLTLWFWHETQSAKETLIFFGAGVAAASQVTASFYTARILAASLKKDTRDEDRERRAEERAAAQEALLLKQQALRFGERWNDPTMYHARDTLRAVRKAHATSADELQKVIDGSETNVIHVMNFLEEIATSCRHEVVDKVVIKDQFDFIIVDAWQTLFPWITQRRKTRSPQLWEDVEKLYAAWKQA
jgi:hypothetical protein